MVARPVISILILLNSYRRLFVLVQKMHFKTANVPRIEAAIRVYALLRRVNNIQSDVTKKMISMLLHPYPKVLPL